MPQKALCALNALCACCEKGHNDGFKVSFFSSSCISCRVKRMKMESNKDLIDLIIFPVSQSVWHMIDGQ